MCRRGGSLVSLQKYITVYMCRDIHLHVLYRGEHRKSSEHCVLCPVCIFSLVWVNCLDCDTWFDFPHISLFSSFLFHLSLKGKLNFALCASKSSVCVMLSVLWRKVCLLFCCSCISFAPLCIYWIVGFVSPHSPCAASSALVCHPFPLPSPSKRHDKAVFCISSMWSVDCFLFTVWVLRTMGRRTCCGLFQEGQSCHAEKSFSSICMTSILASSVLEADAQSLLSCVPRGITVSMQMQQLLMQPDNNIFFCCPVIRRSALCTNGGESSSSPHPAALLGGLMSKARRAWYNWRTDSSSK